MQTPHHDFDHGPDTRLHQHERFLYQLGAAAMGPSSSGYFEFECITGYPFAWISHSGLSGGATVAPYALLRYLDAMSFITLAFNDFSQMGVLTLSPAGMARCAELELLDK